MSLSNDPQLRLNLEQLRKRAKDLRRAHREGQLEAALRIASHLPRARTRSPEEVLHAGFALSEAQFVIAREAGFSSWPSMKHHIEQAAVSEADVVELIVDAAFRGDQAAVRAALERDGAAAKESIYVAVVLADAEAALALLDADSALANRKGGRRNWTPLLYLCNSRYRRNDGHADSERIRLARRLIELGADVNEPGAEPGYGSSNVTLFDQQEWRPIESAACAIASAPLIRLLLESGADLEKTGALLSQAVRGGNPEVLKLLLRASPPWWQVIWALKACSVLDRKDMATILIDHMNPMQPTNEPALLDAIERERDPALIDVLLGPESNEKLEPVWRNAYRATIRFGQHEASGVLRRRGADESAVTDVDRTIAACLAGDSDEVHDLIRMPSYQTAILRQDDHRMLAWVVRTRRYAAVPLMIDAGLNPNVPDRDGETPLHLAVRANSIETVAVLLQAGEMVHVRNFDAETPLDIAVAQNNEGIIRRLLDAGARPRPHEIKLEREEINLLFERAADAVAFGDLEVLRELLDEEPDLVHIRSPRPHRATLLNYCGANGVEDPRQRTPANAPEIARLLIDRGADVNATCNLYGGGANTLGLLLSSVHPVRAGLRTKLMEILVTADALIDGKPGTESIVGAAALGRLDLMMGFVVPGGGLKANTNETQRQAAFYWACDYGRTPAVDFLLKNGADIMGQGPNKMTGLHLAGFSGHLETVRLLLQHKAPLELENAWGGTVLNNILYAAVNHDPTADYVPIVEALIQAGANVMPEVLTWWDQQTTLVSSAKEPIAELLREGRRHTY